MEKPRNRYTIQLDIFRPQPEGPDWRTLPEGNRREAVELLARLLREHHAGRLAEGIGEEASNE